ncbi:hypothetical protein AW736_15425 [Termitidicoccus mucosus]|uniref:Cobyrinate a,c-diamide synthase n=1 Tax=Termitidicoccus mucosus TaxID=1184151 RepID=A0A178IFV9_9BACT|nr:hypothetical protein AW736_15425 [Opitutaceae bacterium TSB47]
MRRTAALNAHPDMPEATRNIPRIVVAGTSSGVGKTTVAVGLVAALRARGLVVQSFKCGPDYIDPSYHSRAAGRPCRNLDSWMLDDSRVAGVFGRACAGADIAVIEGVMGLFDGSDFEDDRASAAQIARLLDAPVLLVLDISKSARSIAAVARGFEHFDPGTPVAAFVLNNAGTEAHAGGCAAAIARHCRAPVVGWLPRNAAFAVGERHLGLVYESGRRASDEFIRGLGAEVAKRFDLDAIIGLAARITPPAAAPDLRCLPEPGRGRGASQTPRPLLAVARDDAFCFYYPDNLDLLEAAGARIAYFKPAQGERPPPGAAGVYLGGGYPELHAKALSENSALWNDLKNAHARGVPIFAECGGFMALAGTLVDAEGRRWPMAGLVPGVVRMGGRLAGFGYRHATALRSNFLVAAGETLRAHEFHYSTWEIEAPDPGGGAATHVPFAWLSRAARRDAPGAPCGCAHGNLLASYLHMHFGQRDGLAERFVARMRDPLAGPPE